MSFENKHPILARADAAQYGAVNNYTNVGYKHEEDPLLPDTRVQQDEIKIKIYKRRWYILLVYGLMAMTQCAVWNTFSPIAEIGEHVFNWDTAELSLLANWGPISYVIGTFAFSWILDAKGLRPACILSGALVVVGTGLRCITSKTSIATPLIHFGQFLNGLAGPIAMGAPPALSAEWFPPEQRTTATALAAISNTLGLAVSFLLGPYLVPVRKLEHHPNSTHQVNTSFFENELPGIPVWLSANNTNTSTSEYDVAEERDSVMKYMYYSFGWSGFCFLLFFTYFPSKPPSPPSPTASMQRLQFKAGLIQLMRNRTFWLICFNYGLSLGIYGCWTGVLDVNLKDHNISQKTAAWLGFYGVIAGCASALAAARGADIFAKHMKWFLIGLYVLGGACFIVFALALVSIIPDTTGVIYSSYILGSLFLGAASPLFFEMACEVTYPVAEGVTTLVLTLVNNIAGLVFLLVQLVPNIGTMWENWSLIGSIFVCIPVLLTLREKYNRLDIDITVDERNRASKDVDST